jgi:outer membrane biosynthesis protein TonB
MEPMILVYMLSVMVIVLIAFIVYLIFGKKVDEDQLKKLFDAIYGCEAVQDFKEETWEKIDKAVRVKVKGTAIEEIWDSWFNDGEKDDEEEEEEEEVKEEKPKSKKGKKEEKKEEPKPVEEEKKEEPKPVEEPKKEDKLKSKYEEIRAKAIAKREEAEKVEEEKKEDTELEIE